MVYGEEDKAREMARSLLPSKNREAARKDRAFIHRSARRQARLALAALARDAEAYEDTAGLEEWPDEEISRLVWHRRGGDKVNPFIRWATAVTKDLPRSSRLSHVRSKVPRSVIGEHALQHLSWAPAFESEADAARREAWRAQRRKPTWLDRGEQAQLLRAVLRAPGGHGALNRWLRAHFVPEYHMEKRSRPCPCRPGCREILEVRIPVEGSRPRLLLGLHDVEAFLAALRGPRTPWAFGPTSRQVEGFHAMDAFLRAFKRCRGNVEATVRALGPYSAASLR